jgi:hypothetical protein
MKNFARLGFATLALAGLASCNSSTTDPGTSNPDTKVIPKKGSTFTTVTTSVSPDGTQSDTTTYTVVSSDTAAFGKSHVVIFSSLSGDSVDSKIVNYETTGDISIYEPDNNIWMTLPVVTNATMKDSLATADGGAIITRTHAADSSFAIGGKTYITKRADVKMESATSIFGTLTISSHSAFVPQIGFVVIDKTDPVEFGGESMPASTETLIGFSLK